MRKTKPTRSINEPLRKRLGISKPGSGAVPAIINLSCSKMRGERWKDMPGYEGLFQVSNMGRVKALPKLTIGKLRKPERILKVAVVFRIEKKEKKRPYVIVHMRKKGTTRMISVAKWVYYLFVSKFDTADPAIQIRCKDGNTLNLCYNNLVLADWSIRPVTQFNALGIPVRHYSNMRKAAKKTGGTVKDIYAAAIGKVHMSAGYFWRFGEYRKKLKLDSIKKTKPEKLIHELLRKRLGIAEVDPNAVPPVLNLSTTTMKGERWKDMPGYEGLYQVSNLGRIKSLSRVIAGGVQKWNNKRILSIFLMTLPNKKQRCMVTFGKEGKLRKISISRWVYYLFVRKFEITDPTIHVLHKDGDPLNLRYKNLLLREPK